MPALIAENAWVEFPVRLPGNTSFKPTGAGGLINQGSHSIIALRDISLELRDGDRVGLIGHNGAGKSTLLRLMAGVYAPSRGRLRAKGTISTLLNTFPGMNVEGTGRENILVCGLHLGLSRRQIAQKTDEIIAFSDLGAYIDLPLRTYSAGMVTRLGFSIATSAEPEILLLDEGLATGDAQFAVKATKRLHDFMARSAIVVIASHSESFIAKMCSRAILLEHGTIVASGPASETINAYGNAIIAAGRSGDIHNLHRAYLLATDMANNGQKPPLELEEQGLRYALGIMPDDLAMLKRYIEVFMLQAKPPPKEQSARLLLHHIERDAARGDLRMELADLTRNGLSDLPADVAERIDQALQHPHKAKQRG